MSLADIKAAQDNLEESFSKRMADLEAQLHVAGPTKDTVAKVAEEFRTFRELMFSMLGLLRQQLNECARTVDTMETRHRRKALIFLGVTEMEHEDCKASIVKVLNNVGISDCASAAISVCHRIGMPSKSRHRPILVWFSGVDLRSAIWRAKTKLKGSSVSVKEFLTKTRQLVFAKARQHFGTRACWTHDGTINIKAPDTSRHKIATLEELNFLTKKYTSIAVGSSLANSNAAGSRQQAT